MPRRRPGRGRERESTRPKGPRAPYGRRRPRCKILRLLQAIPAASALLAPAPASATDADRNVAAGATAPASEARGRASAQPALPPARLDSVHFALAPGAERWLVYPGEAFHFDLSGIPPPPPWQVPEALLLTGGEIMIGLGLNTALYWSMTFINAADWELSWNWPSWRKKLITFEGVTLDTNTLETNAVSHPIAGALYYTAGRANGLSVGQSFLIAAAASTFWEYVLEYREKVSLNDLVATPVGGLALGEPFHQLSLFFGRSARTPATEILSAVFSPFRALGEVAFGQRTPRARSLDALGLPADVWHRFDLYVGGGRTRIGDGATVSAAQIGARSEIITAPGYGRPGRSKGPALGGEMTRLALRLSFAERDLYEFKFRSKVSLLGYSWQSIRGTSPGHLRGHSLFVGATTALDYQMHDWNERYRDKVGVVNIIGPTVDLSLYRGPFRLRASTDVYGDVASVRTPAIRGYVDRHGDRGIKSVLAHQGYYFAVGLTLRQELALEYRRLELVAESNLDFFHSIEGHDRFQDQVTKDFHLSDRRFAYAARLRYHLPGGGGQAPWLGVEHVTRTGRIGGMRVTNAETRYQAGLSVIF